MLELKHISYSVREADETLGILKDISLTVDDHKLVVFTGPNGGGKTTLAKIIMGLVTPTEGQILWNGQDVTHMTITERAKLGISYGFQQPPRFKGITVRDLLTIASGDDKLSKDKCCQYLTKVGLCANDYLDREVDVSLSGGEVKRIEIASILARNADLMIFDEPEAGIDLWSFARLTETFEQIHSQGSATMIIISHQERIISLADEVIVVGDGTLRHRGTPKEILPRILTDTLAQLQQNIAKVIRSAQQNTADGINERLQRLQKELLKKANSKEAYDEIADEIFKLREQHEKCTVAFVLWT